jgi:GAF domain-containing protein
VREDEAQRLSALGVYLAAGAARVNAELDRLARLMAAMMGTPIALVSLLDGAEEIVVGRTGLEIRRTPREGSFCAHAIAAEDMLVVPDTARDPRFSANPLVAGEERLRFYAAAPFAVPLCAAPLGAVCVFDRVPRANLRLSERAVLADFAALAGDQLERLRLAASVRA